MKDSRREHTELQKLFYKGNTEEIQKKLLQKVQRITKDRITRGIQKNYKRENLLREYRSIT